MNRKKLSLAFGMLVAGLIQLNGVLAASTTANNDQISSPEGAEQQTQDSSNRPSQNQSILLAWKNLKHFVSQSDIALWGVVTNIQYKLSDETGTGNTRVPYTFITYEVKEMVHGNIEGNQVVLRFIGGLDENTMRYMGASNVPNFDVGDEDILFVQGNSESISPLVLNDRGRFRVIEGNVFSDTGRAVTLDEKGQLQYGKQHRLEEILTTTVNGSQGTMVMQHKLSSDAVQQASNSISAEELVREIQGMGLPSPASIRFVNADIYKTLIGPSMAPAAPPQAKPQKNVESDDAQHEVNTEIGEMTSQRQPRN